ncbi:hypothetical protein [Agathobaculum butyriciproducens]|jgi:hypothetical protein|uniref:hypothetical protein n=1 Tax=Agathobaculum butyriciproducens TaxID=1628085 RepID=UPI003AAC2BB1
MQTPKSRVYVLLDSESRVLRLEGEYSLPNDLTNWIKIDEGFGDKYALAQSHYCAKPLYDGAVLRYKLVDGKVVERTAEEIEADKAKLPKPVIPKTNAELEQENKLLKAQLNAATERSDFIEDCIAEMAMQVYAE